MYVDTPDIWFALSPNLFDDGAKSSTFKGIPLGTLLPKQTNCSEFEVAYADFPTGGVYYKIRFRFEPTHRSLSFIFDTENDEKLKALADKFSFTNNITDNVPNNGLKSDFKALLNTTEDK
ncbi:hypothetical protein ACQKPX_10635 [Photobacterium sp. DNB23_23_1]